MNRNALRLIGAAVMGSLVVAGCGIGTGSPAGTDDTAAAAPPTAVATPSPTPTQPPAPSPTPIDPTSWVPFSSDRFGYDIAVPSEWTATPATRDWSKAIDSEVTEGADHFVDPGASYQIGVQAFSAPLAAGLSNEDWLALYSPPGTTYEGCTPLPMAQWEAITVDGQAGRFNPDACSASQTFVFTGDRAYVFSIWREAQVDLLKAFLSTVRFHSDAGPEASPSSSP